jgi:hypothetical protein
MKRSVLVWLVVGAITGCAGPTKTEARAPSNRTRPEPAHTKPAATASGLPDWLEKELAGLQLVRADNAIDLVDSVHVVVTPARVVADGEEVARVEPLVAAGQMQKIDALFVRMKNLREAYKSAHPNQPFPGMVTFWIDRRVSALVVKSVFQTCAYAGYPNGNFGVRKRSDAHYARLASDAMVPRPPEQGENGERLGSGRIPPEIIQRIVRRDYPVYRSCYQKGLAKKANLAGRVAVRFVIDKSGKVSEARDNGSTLPDAKVVECILGEFRKLVFPEPEGGTVTVDYPMEFVPE